MHKDSFYWDAMCLRLLYYARILQQCFALLCQRKTVCDLLLFSRLSCVIFNAMHDAIFCFRLFEVLHLHYNSASQYFAIYAQRKTVCDLRLLFRLSDLNGQIPPPLSQTFHTHDDDGHHDEDDNDNGMMMMMMMMTMTMVVVTNYTALTDPCLDL